MVVRQTQTETPVLMADKNMRIGIVVARFNEAITRNLLEACLDELRILGVAPARIRVVWVPGAFEIPLVAWRLARQKNIDAVICLGAVIRGETLHYELVAWETARGIMDVGLLTDKPVIFEVLATDTEDLALKRAQPQGINKGRDAARAAVEMIQVLSALKIKR
ncbi:MAG: 6,7-dimethyl-8-ribityllumazine synthase [Candidatus Omnitrophica bacterium]|nr:6,7-dimethyl-8-ribityllumazine synthase [Candidatus Omnitrophota bacterium]